MCLLVRSLTFLHHHRFNVHEKIQNFMAPAPAGTWHDEMTEELYSSLLGQRKTMMESELVV
jgi:protein AATF/BFR2